MKNYIPVGVKRAQAIADECEKDVVVIVSFDRAYDLLHTTTFGRTPIDKDSAAALGELLSSAAGGDNGLAKFFEDFRTPSAAASMKAQRDELLPIVEEWANTLEGVLRHQRLAPHLAETVKFNEERLAKYRAIIARIRGQQ